MSEHVVAVRLKYINGEFAGVERDVGLTKELQTAMDNAAKSAALLARADKEKAAAAKAAADASRADTLATKAAVDAKRADTLATKAESDASRSAAAAKVAEARAANANEVALAQLARIQAQLSAAKANAARAEANAEAAIRRNTAAIEQQTSAIGNIEQQLGSATSVVKGFFAAWAVQRAVSGMTSMLRIGVDYNSNLQQSRNSIAALIVSLGQVRDENGRLLQGQEKWNASQKISLELTERLQTAALKTPAQFMGLLRTLTESLGPLLGAGVTDPKKIIDFVQRVAQAGATMGMSDDQLGQEARSLIRGELGPDNRLANALLGGLPKQKLEELRSTGKILDYLMGQMEGFAQAGEEANNTVSGAMSNLKDAIEQALGAGTQGTTSDLTRLIHDLTNQIVTFDEQGRATFNKEFVEGVENLSRALMHMGEAAASLAKYLPGAIDYLSKLTSPDIWTGIMTVSGGFLGGVIGGPAGVKIGATASYAYGTAMQKARDDYSRMENPNADSFERRRYNFNSYLATLSPQDRDFQRRIWTETRLRENSDAFATRFWEKKPTAPGGNKIVPPPPGGAGMKAGEQNALDSYRSWMHEFEEGATPANDSITQALQKIAADREQAVDRVAKARARFKGTNHDFGVDLKNVNAAFDNKETAAWEKFDSDAAAFGNWASGFAGDADPLSQKLAQIEQKRAEALKHLDEQKKKLGPTLMADWNGLRAQIDKSFSDDAVEAASALVRPVNDQTLKQAKAIYELDAQARFEIEAEAERKRIDLITDSIDREMEMRMSANERWADEERLRIETTFQSESMKQQALAKLADVLRAKNLAAWGAAEDAKKAQIAGTDEWLTHLKMRIDQQLPPIGNSIQNALVGGIDATRKGFDDLFAGLTSGQLDIAGTLEGVAQDLKSQWSKVFSDIVTNAINGKQTIAESWAQLFPTATKGQWSGSVFGEGAGIGGMIGGIFAKPGNYASEGGAIGGGIGAAIGAYFGGAGGAKIGMMIGSVIGTAIGSSVAKESDKIKVAISGITLDTLRHGGTITDRYQGSLWTSGDGAIDLSDKGISQQARNDLMIQVRRRIKDTMKGWQSILDLFPEEVRKQLESLRSPTISLNGEAAAGDITDQNALSSLDDILTNQLGKAAFSAYSEPLKKGLAAMGVEAGKVRELMAYWGTLEGKELQDAVRDYVTELAHFAGNEKKLSGSPLYALQEANRRNNATPLTNLQDINADMAKVRESLSKMVDVDDQIAAMKTLNGLSDQFFESMIAALQQIDKMAQATHDSIDRQREQIKLAGMTEEEKVDFYYQRMAQLRTQLTNETDPEKIAKIVSQIQDYAGQAFSLAGDNPENRAKLDAILSDIDAISTDQYETARQAILDQQTKAADTLQKAGDTLLAAGIALGGEPPETQRPPDDGRGEVGGGVQAGDPKKPGDPNWDDVANIDKKPALPGGGFDPNPVPPPSGGGVTTPIPIYTGGHSTLMTDVVVSTKTQLALLEQLIAERANQRPGQLPAEQVEQLARTLKEAALSSGGSTLERAVSDLTAQLQTPLVIKLDMTTKVHGDEAIEEWGFTVEQKLSSAIAGFMSAVKSDIDLLRGVNG